MDALSAYYEHYDEDGRLLTRSGNVEFVTTMTYIERFLRPHARILEIGAGTGRYSHALARRGYRVDAVELVQHNIDVFRRHTQPGENITVVQGNALDLSAFADETYDVTLLLGPLYHLAGREEQTRALAEALRVTKPGGVVFAAYCMAHGTMLAYGFARGEVHNILRDTGADPATFAAFPQPWGMFRLMTKEDIDDLRGQFSVAQLHYVAADGYAIHMRPALEQMDEETYGLYLQYHLATCEKADLTGISAHTLDIFRKEK